MQAKDISTEDLLRYIHSAGQGERREVGDWELAQQYPDFPARLMRRKIEKLERQGLIARDPSALMPSYWLTLKASVALKTQLVL